MSSRSWLFLLLILALATALRFYRIDAQSLWSDEGSSVAQALRDIPTIADNAARDIHPPLYYILLHFWVIPFGTSEAGVRSLSALLGVALVALVYWLGRTLWDERTALVAALLAAINPFQIYYAQEARMYMLMAVLGAVCVVSSVKCQVSRGKGQEAGSKEGKERGGATPSRVTALWSRPAPRFWRRWRVGEGVRWGWYGMYGAAAVAGLYTHYFFPIVLVVCNLVFVYDVLFVAARERASSLSLRERVGAAPSRNDGMREKSQASNQFRIKLSIWLCLQLVVLLCFAPWLPVALRQISTWPSGALTFTALDAPLVILRALSEGLSAPAGDAFWLLLMGALLLIGAIPLRRPNPPIGMNPVLVTLLYLLVPVAAMYALGLFKDAFLKFIVVASPAFVLLVANGVGRIASVKYQVSSVKGEGAQTASRSREQRARGRGQGAGLKAQFAIRHSPLATRHSPLATRHSPLATLFTAIVVILLALPSALSLRSYYFDARYARDDYRGIAQMIEALGRSGDGIILDAPGQAEIFGYYYHGDLPVYLLPRQRPADAAATTSELQQLAAAHGRLFVVLWATDESDPARLVETWLDAHTFKSVDSWYGNVRLTMYGTPRALPVVQKSLEMRWGDAIVLKGYALGAESVAAGDILPLTLFWSAEKPIANRYKVFVHLLDPRGFVIAQRDTEPVGGSRPTNGWTVGQTLADAYGLFVPFAMPPLAYQLEIGLYDLNTGARLKNAAGEDHLLLPAVSVRATTSSGTIPGMTPLDLTFGNGLILVGYQIEKVGAEGQRAVEFRPGDAIHLTLYWRRGAGALGTGLYRLQLGEWPGFDTLKPPTHGLYLPERWAEGEVVRDDEIISLENWKAGTYSVYVHGEAITEVVIR